jgi:hypothetical protein
MTNLMKKFLTTRSVERYTERLFWAGRYKRVSKWEETKSQAVQ